MYSITDTYKDTRVLYFEHLLTQHLLHVSLYASIYLPALPLQLMDLLLLVILFIFHLSEDFQQSLHFRLGFSSILFVSGDFLLQAGDAFREFSTGLGFCCCTLSLEKQIKNFNLNSIILKHDPGSGSRCWKCYD